MFAEHVRRAIAATPRTGLDALVKDVWRAYGAGELSDTEAGELCEAIAARRAPRAAPAPRRSTGSRPRSPASVERRRRWAGGGWVPPEVACRFTAAEVACLSVVAAEIALRGRCELPIGAVAGRAGCCETVAKRAVREARRLGLLCVVERRVAAFRNLPNLVTISSASWSTWIRFRARKLGQGGGGTSVPPPESSSFSSLSSGTPAARDRACRKAGGTGNALPGPRPPALGRSTIGRRGAPWGGFDARRVF